MGIPKFGLQYILLSAHHTPPCTSILPLIGKDTKVNFTVIFVQSFTHMALPPGSGPGAGAYAAYVLAVGVPSSVLPSGINYLLHPGHERYEGIRILDEKPLVIDPRLVG